MKVIFLNSILATHTFFTVLCSSGHVLIFGGNGLLGAQCVEDLLAAGYDVTIVNRGNWYWDTKETIRPRVRHIRFDRNGQPPPDFVEFATNTKLDAIVDFTAYVRYFITYIEDLLRSHPPSIYVYISSDSVYEVVEKGNPDHPSREEDAVRPSDPLLRESLSSRDRYGHNKLQVEETLASIGVPHVSLRLPDVLGERDNTHRWWLTVLALTLPIELYQPFPLQNVGHVRISLVYTKDVSRAIRKIIEEPQKFAYEAINLAWAETPTLEEILHGMADTLGVQLHRDLSLAEPREFFPPLFPSVTKGPVDVTKSRGLGIEPMSDWKTALRDTVMFYRNALTDVRFDRERKIVISRLAEILGETDHQTLGAILVENSKVLRDRYEL